jgi:HSP20 family protein
MNTITRWDPLKDLDDFSNRLSSIIGRAPLRKGNGQDENIVTAEWAPPVDIAEDDKEYVVKLEHPK